MKKYILATMVATLVNLPNTMFGQEVIGKIQHEGETFELVALSLSDLHLTGEDRVADVLKMGRILSLRPFTEESRIVVERKTLEPFTRDGRMIFFAREPFTRNNETLWLERFQSNGSSFVPIGDANRGAYATIKWFYRDGDVFLFLRAIHQPKP